MNTLVGAFIISILFMTVAQGQTFYFGADMSYINEMEHCGAIYKVNGEATDPYQIFSDHGANIVRFRLWHTPSWYDDLNDGMRYSDFSDVRQSIMRARDAGMEVLLDFHLSDTWADPGHQVAPRAWASVLDDLPVLQDSLYNYIYSTLDRLAEEDLLPEIVQIGNETNRGILLSQEENDAGWALDWNRNAALFNTAISAARDVESLHQDSIKIALHIADPSQVPWYIGEFIAHGVTDFDIIGMSYYWQWHDVTINDVGNITNALLDVYPDKKVMLLETAYQWTVANADAANNILSAVYPGYSPTSPQNQEKWMIDLAQVFIDNGGSGIFYWEPAWVSTGCHTQWAQGSHWDNATFFDFEHELIEEGGIGWMTYPYENISSTNENNVDGQNMFKVVRSPAGIRIYLNQELNANEAFEIGLYSIDGKRIFHKEEYLDYGQDCLYVTTPVLLPGCYLLVIKSGDGDYGGRLLLIE